MVSSARSSGSVDSLRFQRSSLRYSPHLLRNRWNRILSFFTGLAATFAVLPLVLLLSYVLIKGGSLLSLGLLTELPPPPGLDGGGIANAIIGTLIVTLIACLISIPVGIGGGIFLSEYSSQ